MAESSTWHRTANGRAQRVAGQRSGDGRTAIWQYHRVVLAVCCVYGKVKGRYRLRSGLTLGAGTKMTESKDSFMPAVAAQPE